MSTHENKILIPVKDTKEGIQYEIIAECPNSRVANIICDILKSSEMTENELNELDENRDENEHGLRYNSGQFDGLRNRLKSSKIVESDVKCSNRINGLFEAHLRAWNLFF